MLRAALDLNFRGPNTIPCGTPTYYSFDNGIFIPATAPILHPATSRASFNVAPRQHLTNATTSSLQYDVIGSKKSTTDEATNRRENFSGRSQIAGTRAKESNNSWQREKIVLKHRCAYCGVRYSSPKTLEAHIRFYCAKKPTVVNAQQLPTVYTREFQNGSSGGIKRRLIVADSKPSFPYRSVHSLDQLPEVEFYQRKTSMPDAYRVAEKGQLKRFKVSNDDISQTRGVPVSSYGMNEPMGYWSGGLETRGSLIARQERGKSTNEERKGWASHGSSFIDSSAENSLASPQLSSTNSEWNATLTTMTRIEDENLRPQRSMMAFQSAQDAEKPLDLSFQGITNKPLPNYYFDQNNLDILTRDREGREMEKEVAVENSEKPSVASEAQLPHIEACSKIDITSSAGTIAPEARTEEGKGAHSLQMEVDEGVNGRSRSGSNSSASLNSDVDSGRSTGDSFTDSRNSSSISEDGSFSDSVDEPMSPKKLAGVSQCIYCKEIFYKRKNFLAHNDQHCPSRRIVNNQDEIATKKCLTTAGNDDVYLTIGDGVKTKGSSFKERSFLGMPLLTKDEDRKPELQEIEKKERNSENIANESILYGFPTVKPSKMSNLPLPTHISSPVQCPLCDYIAINASSHLFQHLNHGHGPSTKGCGCSMCSHRGATEEEFRHHGRLHQNAVQSFADEDTVEFVEYSTSLKTPPTKFAPIHHIRMVEPYKRRRARSSKRMVPHAYQLPTCAMTSTDLSTPKLLIENCVDGRRGASYVDPRQPAKELAPLDGKTGLYCCRDCDIAFMYPTSFIAHKTYYCSSHVCAKREN